MKQEAKMGVAKRGRRKKQGKQRRIVKLESLKQLNLNAAGLDIGAAEIYAAVPEDRAAVSTGSRSMKSWKSGGSSYIWSMPAR